MDPQRIVNLLPGEAEVRMDFIQNAGIQAQREFFVHQYVSLLCMVVQWKTVEDETETLRTRTILYMSDDKIHDGAFAALCLKHLISQVLPVLPQLQNNWTRLIVSSDNGRRSPILSCFLCF